jgi:hypothetical protein
LRARARSLELYRASDDNRTAAHAGVTFEAEASDERKTRGDVDKTRISVRRASARTGYLATAKVERMVAGGRPMEVTFVRFTEPAGGRLT